MLGEDAGTAARVLRRFRPDPRSPTSGSSRSRAGAPGRVRPTPRPSPGDQRRPRAHRRRSALGPHRGLRDPGRRAPSWARARVDLRPLARRRRGRARRRRGEGARRHPRPRGRGLGPPGAGRARRPVRSGRRRCGDPAPGAGAAPRPLAGPEKLASLWDVAVVHPAVSTDWDRFRRRHARWWGPDAAGGWSPARPRSTPRAGSPLLPSPPSSRPSTPRARAAVADVAATRAAWATVDPGGIGTSALVVGPAPAAVRTRPASWRRWSVTTTTGIAVGATGVFAAASAPICGRSPWSGQRSRWSGPAAVVGPGGRRPRDARGPRRRRPRRPRRGRPTGPGRRSCRGRARADRRAGRHGGGVPDDAATTWADALAEARPASTGPAGSRRATTPGVPAASAPPAGGRGLPPGLPVPAPRRPPRPRRHPGVHRPRPHRRPRAPRRPRLHPPLALTDTSTLPTRVRRRRQIRCCLPGGLRPTWRTLADRCLPPIDTMPRGSVGCHWHLRRHGSLLAGRGRGGGHDSSGECGFHLGHRQRVSHRGTGPVHCFRRGSGGPAAEARPSSDDGGSSGVTSWSTSGPSTHERSRPASRGLRHGRRPGRCTTKTQRATGPASTRG